MNHFLKNSAVFYWQKCVLKNRNIGPWPKRKKRKKKMYFITFKKTEPLCPPTLDKNLRPRAMKGKRRNSPVSRRKGHS
jgi:hypothetical protein